MRLAESFVMVSLCVVGCSIRVSMVCALQLCDIKAAGGFVSREEHNGRVIKKSCFPRQQGFGPGDPFEGFVLWSFPSGILGPWVCGPGAPVIRF